MKKERATIHDIARTLNVTASTVSRALKDHPRISTETKAAVAKAATLLNYQPNHIASALRKGKSNIVGIIVPTVDRTFFSSVVRGIEEMVNTAGYNVMICQTYDSYEKEAATVEALLNARVDGVIASHAKETQDFSHFTKVKERGIPLIFFDRSKEDIGISHVVIDDYYGAYKATEHLIQQGCRRIAHFTNTRNISIYKERLRGYCDALMNNGIHPNDAYVVKSNLQLEDGRAGMENLLMLSVPPDAVFSASALGIMAHYRSARKNAFMFPNRLP